MPFPSSPIVKWRTLWSTGLLWSTLAWFTVPFATQAEPGESLEALRAEVESMAELHGPDDARVGLALDALGGALRARGRYEEALTAYRRAQAVLQAALGAESEDVLVDRNNLAFTLQLAGDLAAARDHYAAILELAPDVFGEPSDAVGQIALNLAITSLGLGELDQAEESGRRAVRSFESVGGPDSPAVAGPLGVVATARQRLGDLGEAQSLHERALDLLVRTLGPDHIEVTGPLNNLAEVHLQRGDLEGARRRLERAIVLWETQAGQPPQLDTSLSNLAGVLLEQGDLRGALRVQERALALVERRVGPDALELSHHLNVLGDTQRELGALAAAKESLERALAIRRRGPDEQLVAETLNNLGLVHQELGDDARAEDCLREALGIFEARLGKEHRTVGVLLENLAASVRRRGAWDAARELQARGLRILEASRGAYHPDVARAHDALARLELGLERIDAALAHVQALAGIQDTRLPLVLATMPETEVVSYRATLRAQLDTQLGVALGRGTPADLEFAVNRVLAWNDLGVRPVASARRVLAARSEEDPRVGRLRAVNAALGSAALGLVLPAGERAEGHPDELRAERAALERSLLAEENSAPLVSPALRWRELRDRLPADAAHVGFATYRPWNTRVGGKATPISEDAQLVAFVTRRPSSSPVVIELGAVGSIEQDVAAWRAEIVGTSTARGLGIPDPVEGLDADVALHGSIWKPLESALDGVKTVIVSPAGPLTRVPFAALRDDAGRFLVEDRSFASIVDVRAFLAPAKKRSATPSLLVVGNVDFGGEARAHAPDRDSNERPGGRSPTRSELAQRWAATPWSPLPATAEEAGAVDVLHRRLFPEGQRLLLQGVEPAESRLKEEMERFDVVHLATHGFVAAALPGGGGATVSEYLPGLLSGVVCAGAAGRPGPAEDGYLTAEELGWLDLEGLELVALSACETGLGRSQAGESLLGLRRALAFAGADSVLSSLWAVPDRATATLMADFYRGLWEEGFAPHEALRLAQLAALGRDREAGRGDSPYAWGAFVIDGFR